MLPSPKTIDTVNLVDFATSPTREIYSPIINNLSIPMPEFNIELTRPTFQSEANKIINPLINYFLKYINKYLPLEFK